METGYLFRIQRDGKYENVDLADMTEAEIKATLCDKDKDFLLQLIIGLLNNIQVKDGPEEE